MASLRTPCSILFRARALRPAAIVLPTAVASLNRTYHQSGRLAAYKDDQDRESLKPRPTDGTQSGSVYDVVDKKDASFNPKNTEPEAERESAARESNGNPLEASGANQELSRPQKPEGPIDTSDKKTRSGGSRGKKHGKVAPM